MKGKCGGGAEKRGISILLFPVVHERLQNERGGHLIDHAAVLLTGVAGLIQNFVGLAAGQPLIPQVDGQAGQLTQLGGKFLRLFSLRAWLARQMHGIPHHNARHAEPAIVPPLQRQHRLRRQPQFVRHSHPDAPIADVETEIARLRCGVQLSAPGYQLKAPSLPEEMPCPGRESRYNQR